MEGIQISEFLKWMEKMRALEEASVALAPDLDEAPMHESEVDIDVDLIKSIESDFAQQADGILESLKLSHLRRLATTIPKDEPLKNNLYDYNLYDLILSNKIEDSNSIELRK